MSKSKIRSRPPSLDDRKNAAEAFIEAAERPAEAPSAEDRSGAAGDAASQNSTTPTRGEGGGAATTPAPAEPLPWDDPKVREDVKKLFSLRLPEPLMLKLQYISSKTGKSMHQYCLDHLIPAIEADADALTKER